LESITDAEDDATRAREFFNAAHDGRKTGDGSAAKVVAVRESTGKDDDVRAGEIGGLVPDKFRLLAENVMGDVESVIITIGAGKNYDAEFHAFTLVLEREVSRNHILPYPRTEFADGVAPVAESQSTLKVRAVALSSRKKSRR
jgi:hypothetical protein